MYYHVNMHYGLGNYSPTQELFGWHLILPPVSTTMWEMSHLLTEVLWILLEICRWCTNLRRVSRDCSSSTDYSDPVGLSPLILVSKVKGGWSSIKHKLVKCVFDSHSLVAACSLSSLPLLFWECFRWLVTLAPPSQVQTTARPNALIQPPMSAMSAFLHYFVIVVFTSYT